MNDFKKISSLSNPLLKKVLVLQEKSRERKKTERFIVEGQREIELALKGGFEIDTLLFCDAYYPSHNLATLPGIKNAQIIEITKEVYQKLAYRTTTEGIITILKSKTLALEELSFRTQTPLILVAEAPEKPGNIGALLRTADAANVDAVLIANPKTDLYNPNIIRSSVGCVFTTTIATATSSEIIHYLKNHNINIYCAALQASKTYHNQNFKSATAIVVGTEATGLSKEWIDNATQNIIIPMQGEIDSMNVSVAAAILIFEAKRQRGF